ncbi:NADPH-dependent FMN reductase [Dokdonella soli]|uniref:NAD(P)H-dependent FMN reductase n=1 Tax=Dokdonella soli TaxID=529810 RepID=A0ABP3TN47_9GAMM
MNPPSNLSKMFTAPTTTHILAISGSLRRGSYNRRLLETAAELAPAGTSITLYDELATIPMFDEDLESATGGGPEPVRRLRDAVASAHGLLIATPEYNQSLPGVLKNAIDWLSRGTPMELLAGKPVAIVGASGGRWGTRLAQAALRQVLNATEALVMPAPALHVAQAESLFDQQGRLVDVRTRQALESVVISLTEWIARVAPEQSDEDVARCA